MSYGVCKFCNLSPVGSQLFVDVHECHSLQLALFQIISSVIFDAFIGRAPE